MGNFVDFNEQIGAMRIAIANELEGLFLESNTDAISCNDDGLEILTPDGTETVTKIWLGEHEHAGFYSHYTCLLTESGNHWAVMDLETDDMVAIYEHVWYQLKEKNG